MVKKDMRGSTSRTDQLLFYSAKRSAIAYASPNQPTISVNLQTNTLPNNTLRSDWEYTSARCSGGSTNHFHLL